jgi:hypothetical protein
MLKTVLEEKEWLLTGSFQKKKLRESTVYYTLLGYHGKKS